MTTMRDVVRAGVPIVGAAVVAMAPIEMDHHVRSAMAIAVAMVLCWMTGVLHPAIVGFVGCFLFRATGDVGFDTAFAGFGTTTPWFLYGTLLLFNAAERSGLIQWLGAHTPRPLVRSSMAAGVALIAVSYLLAFIVPSSLARGTLVAILAVAWARQSLYPGTAVTSALVLTATYSAAMFGHTDMPGGPAVIMGWDLAAAAALLVALVWLTRSATASSAAPVPDEVASTALDVRVAAPVAIAAGLWATTSLHDIPPALVGLGAGLVSCLPGFAPRAGQGPTNPDPLAIILAGAAISIPVVLVETHAVDVLTHVWLATNQRAGVLPDNLVAYWATTGYRLFSPDGAQPGLPALIGPAGGAAAWAYAGSTMLALHQSPALIFGLSVAGFRGWQVLAAGLSVLAAGSVVVMLF